MAAELEAKVEEHEVLLRGTLKEPGLGMVMRMDRVERLVAQLMKISWLVLGAAIVTLFAMLSKR